jgi:hypothetical protein
MAYATSSDVSNRYGDIAEADAQRVETLLDDASAIIRSLGGKASSALSDDEAAVYRSICCAMVHRVMISPAWAALGVTQHSQTAGAFSESYSFGNPNGDLYLTKSEKKTLGLAKSRIGTIAPDRMPEEVPES